MTGKNKIRSIRFSDELYELIDRQTGDTFTQKLENLVTRCVLELPQKEKELKDIRATIDQERKNLRRIREAKQKMEQNIRDLNWQLENLQHQANRITKALEKIEL